MIDAFHPSFRLSGIEFCRAIAYWPVWENLVTPSAQKPRSIGIIGAGIVGMSAALYLQRDGHRVKVIDYRQPGTATSFGNAGAIVTAAIEPTSTPGVLRHIPRYLFDPSSAVRVKWSYLPYIAPWLVRFILQSRHAHVQHAAAALKPLVSAAYGAHLELAGIAGTLDLLRPTGWLKLFRTERGYAATELQRRLMEMHAIRYEILETDEIHQLEPHLARIFVKGLYHGDSASIRQPKRLIEGYARAFLQAGGEFIQEQVQSLHLLENAQVRLRCDLGFRDFDEVVVAAGAWSKRFCSMTGDKVILDTERGYHLNVERGQAGEIRRPLCFPEDSFVIAPMDDGIRLTSGEELAGLDAEPDFSRIHRLLPKAREALPGLSDRVTREWMGRRPSTPDSLPVIGRSPMAAQVIYAFGHHHLGMTLGPVTGRIIAQLVRGEKPVMDLGPYRIGRFRLFGG
jgi:D-amino-acid dehydrogenase